LVSVVAAAKLMEPAAAESNAGCAIERAAVASWRAELAERADAAALAARVTRPVGGGEAAAAGRALLVADEREASEAAREGRWDMTLRKDN
jgi:hypothetical protein